MLLNRYIGATQFVAGASFLDGRAILDVYEGYNTGASIEYIRRGEFEVNNIENLGVFSQNVAIEAHTKLKRLDYANLVIGRQFINHFVYEETFDNDNTFVQNWRAYDGGWSVTGGALVFDRNTTSNTSEIVAYTGNQDIDDFILIVKFKCDEFDTAGAGNNLFILFNVQDYSRTNYTAYGVRLIGANINELQLAKIVNASTVYSTGRSYNPANNTWYWLKIVRRGNRMDVLISTDGISYTLVFTQTDNMLVGGGIAFRGYGAATSVSITIDEISLITLDTQYTNGDIIKHAVNLGGVNNVNIQSELTGVSGWVASIGSCWTVGNTNNIQQIELHHSTTGNSWHLLYTPGSTLNNFALDGEIYGVSGNQAGIFVGSSNRFYGNYYSFISSSAPSYTAGRSCNTVENYINGRFTYRGTGDFFLPQGGQWYKFRMIKNGYDIRWYINGQLVNIARGTSLSDVTANAVGLFALQAGVSQTTTSWRNIRISELDDLVEDIQIDTNTPVSSVVNRYLPEGFVANWHGITADIFEIGASRGTHGISQYIINSSHAIDPSAGINFAIARSDESIAKSDIYNKRIFEQMDNTRITFTQDSSIQSKTDAYNIAQAQNVASNQTLNNVSCDIRPRVDLERYDTIDMVDAGLGVSKKLFVQSFLTSYNADGSFIQSLQLIE